MKIRCQYTQAYSTALVSILEKNGIQHKTVGNGVLIPSMLSFSVYEGTREHEIIECCVQHNALNPLRFAEYSEDEINDSALLVMRPKKQCIHPINEDKVFEFTCPYQNRHGVQKYRHRRQCGLFMIAKEPKLHRNTAFFSIDSGFSELFVDHRVKEMAQAFGLKGIAFSPVLLKNGLPSDTLYQITSEHVINIKEINMGGGERQVKCPYCGRVQMIIDPSYQLQLKWNLDEHEQDFYMTESIFGEGQAEPMFLISHRFYEIVKQKQLAKNLHIEPVKLIDP